MSNLRPRFKLLFDGQAEYIDVTPGEHWEEWEQAVNQLGQRYPLWQYSRHDTLCLQHDYFHAIHWASDGTGIYLARESIHAGLVPQPMPTRETIPPAPTAPAKPQQLSLLDLIGSPA